MSVEFGQFGIQRGPAGRCGRRRSGGPGVARQLAPGVGQPAISVGQSASSSSRPGRARGSIRRPGSQRGPTPEPPRGRGDPCGPGRTTARLRAPAGGPGRADVEHGRIEVGPARRGGGVPGRGAGQQFVAGAAPAAEPSSASASPSGDRLDASRISAVELVVGRRAEQQWRPSCGPVGRHGVERHPDGFVGRGPACRSGSRRPPASDRPSPRSPPCPGPARTTGQGGGEHRAGRSRRLASASGGTTRGRTVAPGQLAVARRPERQPPGRWGRAAAAA